MFNNVPTTTSAAAATTTTLHHHAGVDPTIMGYGPVPAIRGLLKSSGLTVDQVSSRMSPLLSPVITSSFPCRLICLKSTRRSPASACHANIPQIRNNLHITLEYPSHDLQILFILPAYRMPRGVTRRQVLGLRERPWPRPLPLQR